MAPRQVADPAARRPAVLPVPASKVRVRMEFTYDRGGLGKGGT